MLSLCIPGCSGSYHNHISLVVHSFPDLNSSSVVREAFARHPVLAPVAAGSSGTPVVVRSVAPSLESIALSSAAFWNSYLSVGGGTREIVLDIEVSSFPGTVVGTAACHFNRPSGNRECDLKIDASFAYYQFVMLHEIAHAVLLWGHTPPLCVSDGDGTERCIDGGGHWSPYESGEVLSPYVGDTMFVSDYTVLAASSSQSGGNGITGLCDATCTSDCSDNAIYAAAPRVCGHSNDDVKPLDLGGGGGGGGGAADAECGEGCIAGIAGGIVVFFVIVFAVTCRSNSYERI